MENFHVIYVNNPWWRDPSEFNNDIHIRNFENSTVKWFPGTFEEDDFVYPAIYTLRGPR